MRSLTLEEKTNYFFSNNRDKGRKAWVIGNDLMALILGKVKERKSSTKQRFDGLALYNSFYLMLTRGISFKEADPKCTNRTAINNIHQILLEHTDLQPGVIENITLNSVRALALVRKKVEMSKGKTMKEICIEHKISLL